MAVEVYMVYFGHCFFEQSLSPDKILINVALSFDQHHH